MVGNLLCGSGLIRGKGSTEHVRGRFVDVTPNFPEAACCVLEMLREIYKNDALARRQRISTVGCRAFQQAESRGLIEDFGCLSDQLDSHLRGDRIGDGPR
jgi:hypothetical protein